MAKSIWKPGVKITRKEKKALRRLMPHPNKGRRHYQWRVENTRISRIMKDVINDDGTLNIVNVAKRTTRVSDKLTMKREFIYTLPNSSDERNIQAFRPRLMEGFSESDKERFNEICREVLEQQLIDGLKNRLTAREIEGEHLRGQASDVSSVPKE
ncbi:hypothetical protein [Klebsiella phage phiKp_32]|nr:hypothetical protein [Klebsiella phage phiKp_32]